MNKSLGLLVLLGAFGLAAPAAAFDQLRQFIGTMSMGSHDEFFYAAPLHGFSAESPTLLGIADDGIRTALLGGEAAGATAITMTGVDFSAVTGVLTYGQPPDEISVLFGQPGFTTDAPQTLAARGFEERSVNGYQVMALAEDYALDLATARNGDPFNAGLGKSQRLAIGGDFMVRTAGWQPLEALLEQLPTRPTLDGSAWQSMLDGIAAASGDGAHLDAAIGWPGSAFIDTPMPDMETFELGPDKTKLKRAPGELPIFPAALFALTQTADTASVHIALPFGRIDDAERAATTLAERLVLNPLTPHRPRIEITGPIELPVAVVSLDYPVAEAATARDLLLSWNGDILQRRFAPLLLSF